jgi:hypothetical protein
MEDNIWYDIFLENLYDKCSKKTQLVDEIQELLNIEKEAIYRRLRKEVPFPAHELVKIAVAWNISLDEIVDIHSGLVPFQLQPINYLNPSKKEFINLQKRARALDEVKYFKESEYMEVSNKLPRPLYIGSLLLYRFEIFKWVYQYNIDAEQKPFAEVIIPLDVCNEFEIYSKNIKYIANSYFVLDPMVFNFMVQNIQYFHSILLVTDEEKKAMKEQLFSMLDYLNEIADHGCYPDSLKKVNIYISQLSINTNYSYYYTDKIKSARIHAFGKFDIVSFDNEMVKNFRYWLNLKKRTSIQISETNERNRIEYFKKQRDIVEEL